MTIKKHIPNLLTLCNLLAGCIGIVLAFQWELSSAIYLIWVALLFDFLDGFTARLLNVQSAIGKELDSLADMVTFGVLPSVLMFQMLSHHSNHAWLPFIAFFIAACSALRLAKFNIDTTQQDTFIGLPTPANALFISGLYPLFIHPEYGHLVNSYTLATITILFSLLLVAPIRLFALKFKNYTWKDNKVRFTFLLLSVLCIITIKTFAIPLIIVGYILVSLCVDS